MSNKMHWLNTTGGPFVCGDAAVAELWRGIYGSSGPSGPTEQTDYERACGVTNYLQSVPCGADQLVVLGDEPLQSALFINFRNETCIARWVYSRSSDVNDFIFNADGLEEIEARIQIPLLSGWLVLFDSSTSLDKCEQIAVSRMQISAGTYAITSEKAEHAKDKSFIIHRFLRTNS